ncbi:hypothetical protein FA09DRAFT_346541 [Tilletiopsis washingtonensis]|uniref:Uncharacterized protein n=1 Tax=Tilletiopsis washingtonensis TaxID=58919 RepID=A0A316Z6L9_9BASI|nr:hypothetical protein FA09DRAFT_346541 [Tilletiopsis washingtonensis]PWN96936.1 hypothetical protein FA09DRAFT_346541 [Tilletiopsis washingtonensis]
MSLARRESTVFSHPRHPSSASSQPHPRRDDSRAASAAAPPQTPMPAARFDSLADLLHDAGYKETRIFTPVASSSAAAAGGAASAAGAASMSASAGRASTPRSSGSPRRTAHPGGSSSRRMPSRAPVKGATATLKQKPSGSWFSSFWDATLGASASSSSGAVRSEGKENVGVDVGVGASGEGKARELRKVKSTAALSSSSSFSTSASAKRAPLSPLRGSSDRASMTVSTSSAASTSTASPRRAVAASPSATASTVTTTRPRTLGRAKSSAALGGLWCGSLRYRTDASSLATEVVDKEEMTPSSHAAASRSLPRRGAGKSRVGLASAFAPEDEQPGEPGSPSISQEARRMRRERAAWRESVSSLKAFAASSSHRTTSTPAISVQPASPGRCDTAATRRTLAELFAAPAQPVVSRDDAVVLRNDGCLWPAGAGLRRMRSVEALENAAKALARGESDSGSAIQIASTICDGAAPSTSSFSVSAPATPRTAISAHISPPRPSAVVVETTSVIIAPSPSPPRPSPPRGPPALVLTSPTGMSAPQILDLMAKEFEPRSFSPEQILRSQLPRPAARARTLPARNFGVRSSGSGGSGEESTSSTGAGSASGTRRGRRRASRTDESSSGTNTVTVIGSSSTQQQSTAASTHSTLTAPTSRSLSSRGRRRKPIPSMDTASSSSASFGSASTRLSRAAAASTRHEDDPFVDRTNRFEKQQQQQQQGSLSHRPASLPRRKAPGVRGALPAPPPPALPSATQQQQMPCSGSASASSDSPGMAARRRRLAARPSIAGMASASGSANGAAVLA